MNFLKIFVCTINTLLLANFAVADEKLSTVSTSENLLQVMLGLVIILAAIFSMAYFVKRVGQRSGLLRDGLKVVASLPLSTRESIALIQVGEQQILVGVAPGRVNHIQTLEETIPLNSGVKSPLDFRKTLKEILNKPIENENKHRAV